VANNLIGAKAKTLTKHVNENGVPMDRNDDYECNARGVLGRVHVHSGCG
jgi:hypothetical protein